MKTIKGIDDYLDKELFEAQGMPVPQENYRTLFRLIVMVAPDKGEECLAAFDLNLKLKTHKETDIELEESEHKLLRERIVANPTGLIPYYKAQLLRKLG